MTNKISPQVQNAIECHLDELEIKCSKGRRIDAKKVGLGCLIQNNAGNYFTFFKNGNHLWESEKAIKLAMRHLGFSEHVKKILQGSNYYLPTSIQDEFWNEFYKRLKFVIFYKGKAVNAEIEKSIKDIEGGYLGEAVERLNSITL